MNQYTSMGQDNIIIIIIIMNQYASMGQEI
jgi:hypothetical protein